MNLRTLLVTDSVGLPRPQIGLTFDDTYASKLDKLVVLSGGGYTIKDFVERAKNTASCYVPGDFDLGVIQLGLVDCALRPIPASARSRISKLPFPLKQIAIKVIHVLRPQLVQLQSYQYTPIDEWTYYYNELLGIVCKLCKTTIVIEIAPVRKSVELHSPGLSQQIAVYNSQIEWMNLDGRAMVIPVWELKDLEEVYLTDDGHITAASHEAIWIKIREALKKRETL